MTSCTGISRPSPITAPRASRRTRPPADLRGAAATGVFLRTWNVRRVDRYLERVEAGTAALAGQEALGAWEKEQERLVLGLRRAAGVEWGPAAGRLAESPSGRRLREAGVLVVGGGRLRVARPLLGSEVARALLALEPPDC